MEVYPSWRQERGNLGPLFDSARSSLDVHPWNYLESNRRRGGLIEASVELCYASPYHAAFRGILAHRAEQSQTKLKKSPPITYIAYQRRNACARRQCRHLAGHRNMHLDSYLFFDSHPNPRPDSSIFHIYLRLSSISTTQSRSKYETSTRN